MLRASRERGPFVGREAELASLAYAWERASRASERRVVLVGGDPAIGKSRLVARFAEGRTAVVLDEWPFGPAPGADRFRVFEEWSASLEGLLLLEDLHAADGSTLAVLEHVVRAPGPPLLVVATYRRAELALNERVTAVVERLRALGRFERVLLGGLDVGDIAALAGPDAPVEELHARTGGNPLHVAELLRWPLDNAPASLRSLLGLRLAGLGPQTRIALSGAAVLGRSFDAELVGPVAGQEADVAAAALREAEAAGVIAGTDFEHDLFREVELAELTPMRRATLHRRALEALAARDASPVALARHALRAGEGEQAVDRAAGGAAALVDALAYEAGADLYEEALAALGPWDPWRRCDLLLAQGDAWARAGDRPAARRAFADAFQGAEQLDDADRRASAALGFAGPRSAGEDPALLEVALASLPPGGALPARVLARLAEARLDEGDAGERLSGEALRLAEESGDDGAVAAAVRARLAALWVPGRAAERLPLAARLPDEEGLPWTVAALLEQGDLAAVDALPTDDAYAADVLSALRALLDARFDEAVELASAAAQQRRGRPEAVQTLALQMFVARAEQDRLHETRHGVAEFVALHPGWRTALALCDARTGRFGDAHVVLRTLGDVPRDGLWLGFMCVAAQACVEGGDETRAAHLVDLLSPYGAGWAAFGWAATWGPVALWLAELCSLLGRFEDARGWAEGVGVAGSRAWSLRARYVRARLGLEPSGALGSVVREAREAGMKLLAAQAKRARAPVA